MSYRTIRRVLGETSLERKCRILFGVCLLFLIGGAFWFVNSISEELAVKNIRSRGSDLITMRLMYVHSVNREVKNNPQMDLDYVEYVFGLLARNQNYQWKTLMPEGATFLAEMDESEFASTPEESLILKDLLAEWRQQPSEPPKEKLLPPPNTLPPLAQQTPHATPIFRDRRLPQVDEYHYYEPISFS